MELNEAVKPVNARQQAWDRYWAAEVLDTDFLFAKLDGDITSEEYEAGKFMFRAEADRLYKEYLKTYPVEVAETPPAAVSGPVETGVSPEDERSQIAPPPVILTLQP